MPDLAPPGPPTPFPPSPPGGTPGGARFDPAAVQAVGAALGRAAGLAPADAGLLAASLVDADLHGTSTHGISRLAVSLRRVRRGVTDPRAELRIERTRGAVLTADAAHGLGQVQASRVLDRLEPLARESGVAAATVRRSGHCGALWWYANRAAARGMALLAMTNAEPAVAPAGSGKAYFGTNPLAVSFPTGKGYPVKIDLATSAVARGNVIAASRRGEPLPAGWAYDERGEPTTDAAAALLGSLVPMAGAKGYALALMVEIFAGVLSGSAVGAGVASTSKHPDRPQDVGHFFCLVDLAAFLDPAEFTARIDRTIDELKACPPRPGVAEVLIPGERAHRLAQQHRRDGIPVDEQTRQELRRLGAEWGVDAELRPVNAGESSGPG